MTYHCDPSPALIISVGSEPHAHLAMRRQWPHQSQHTGAKKVYRVMHYCMIMHKKYGTERQNAVDNGDALFFRCWRVLV